MADPAVERAYRSLQLAPDRHDTSALRHAHDPTHHIQISIPSLCPHSDHSIQSRQLHLQSVKPRDAQKGRPARPQTKPTPEVYPLGYIEDVGETRTKLAAFFSVPIKSGIELHTKPHTARLGPTVRHDCLVPQYGLGRSQQCGRHLARLTAGEQ